MPVDTLHTGYQERIPDFESIRDGLEGDRRVKAKKQRYLPAPPGMASAGNEVSATRGKRTTTAPYSFYLSFAEFPEIIEPALTGFQGIVHGRLPRVVLPPPMEYLLEDATTEGRALQILWMTITREILAGGRVGLLADVREDNRVRFAVYNVESIINWQARVESEGGGANFVVLIENRELRDDESDPFDTRPRRFYKELRLMNDVYQIRHWRDTGEFQQPTIVTGTSFQSIPIPTARVNMAGEPAVVLVDGNEWNEVELFGSTFNFIPFIPINALDIGFTYGAIPMLPLTRRAYSVYRLTADYRRALYQKADPQAWVTGVSDEEEIPTRIGGDTIWHFSNPEAKVGFLDIDGDGIPLMREAIQDELQRFDQEGGRLLSTTMRPESGDALKKRLLAHQVTLRNIVINAGTGFQQALRMVAVMLGVNPDLVTFEPDLDFAEPTMSSQTFLEFVQAKQIGGPLSLESIHSLARRGGLTEKTFEQETKQAEEETEAAEAFGVAKPEEPEPEEEAPEVELQGIAMTPS
jgi:hypothetical protein